MYKIEKNKVTEEFSLYEISTGITLGIFSEHGNAKKVYNFMKNGGAFNGWTPTFILTKAVI